MKILNFFIFALLVLLIPKSGVSGSYSADFILKQVKQKKLPGICAYMGVSYAGRTSKGKQLRKKFGPDWNHMHHYCWALVDVQKGKYGQAVGNLDYVLRNSSKDFTLRPMVLSQKAFVLQMNKQYNEAISVYQELVRIKPDSEQGWVGMANLYLLLDNQSSARMVAKKGLKYLPNSKKLKSFLGRGQ